MKTRNKAKQFNFKKSQNMLVIEPKAEAQIRLLIAKLNKVHEDYYKRAYLILNQILKIRQRQRFQYGFTDLAREKGINLSSHQISYVLNYKYISPTNLKRINRGNLRVGTALFIIKQNKEFRKPELQDKVVKMYLDGKTNTSILSRLSNRIVLDNIVENRDIKEADMLALRIYHILEERLKMLKARKNLFSDVQILHSIRNAGARIVEEAENILKFGQNVKKKEVELIARQKQKKKAKSLDFLDEKEEEEK